MTLDERIAVALERIATALEARECKSCRLHAASLREKNASLIQSSGLNTTSTGTGMVHPMQSIMCEVCFRGGGMHENGCTRG